MAEEKQGFFARLVSGLTKTRNSISSGFSSIFGSYSVIDEDFYEELEEVLIMADIGIKTTTDIIEALRVKVREQRIKEPEECRQVLIDEIKEKLKVSDADYEFENRKSVVMLIGVNGVGKTTTVGKLSSLLKSNGKKVLIAAADTFRAAAAEQLEEWSHRAGVPMVRGQEGADPGSVIFDAVSSAKAHNTDILICDTAGRLHNKKNLMSELSKIRRVIDRELPNAKCEVLLVIDATTGQNAIAQAKAFGESVGLTGIIVTKLDGTAKGGVAIAVKEELGIPVRFIGVGEGADDMHPFDAEQFADAII